MHIYRDIELSSPDIEIYNLLFLYSFIYIYIYVYIYILELQAVSTDSGSSRSSIKVADFGFAQRLITTSPNGLHFYGV